MLKAHALDSFYVKIVPARLSYYRLSALARSKLQDNNHLFATGKVSLQRTDNAYSIIGLSAC